MLRTLISLCALLAALFFVFRGVQESSAKGQTIGESPAVSKMPDVYRQFILQRALEMKRNEQENHTPTTDAEQALVRALAEVEFGWNLLTLSEQGDPFREPIKTQSIGPAYQLELTFPDDDTFYAPDTVEQAPAPKQRQLTDAEQRLRDKIEHCLAVYQPKLELSAADHNCWEVMHALIGYGIENEIVVGRQRYNAIGYLCYVGKCKGFELFENDRGRLKAKQGHGVQGHHGQFLAMLAQHAVTPDYQIKAGGQDFTIHDLIEFEKQTCVPRSELTFKLIALTHYLDSDAIWSNRHGQWSIPRLIQEELNQPVIGSACGGTHRLMGLSYAVRYRESREEPMTGQWGRAATYVNDYVDYAFSLQNRNGSFSTAWFEGRADSRDLQRYQETTGHIVEWLAFTLPQERLNDPTMVSAVDFLADLMLQNENTRWKIGPRGHAIRALALYHERAFGNAVIGSEAQDVATR